MMANHANTVTIVNGMIGSVNKTGPASVLERRRIAGGSGFDRMAEASKKNLCRGRLPRVGT
jgi:hypothetical protein